MPIGIIARKIGMSRVFTEDGNSVPVTVLEVEPNRVTQVRSGDRDGYSAVQMTVGTRRDTRVTRPMAGHFAAAGVPAGRVVCEFRLGDGEQTDLQPGAEVKADIFEAGQKVDVQGTTIGRGFAGVIKRHHFGGGRASHGNSLSHRAPGSIGQNQDPGRVFPGKKMAGHMGNVTRTVHNLEVVRVDTERNLLLVRGAVPGPKGRDVLVRPTVRNKR